MDETRDYHTKWTQKDKEKMPYDRTYMQNLKYDTNKPVWNRNRLTDIEKDIVFKEGRGMRGWEERNQKFGVTDANYYI